MICMFLAGNAIFASCRFAVDGPSRTRGPSCVGQRVTGRKNFSTAPPRTGLLASLGIFATATSAAGCLGETGRNEVRRCFGMSSGSTTPEPQVKPEPLASKGIAA